MVTASGFLEAVLESLTAAVLYDAGRGSVDKVLSRSLKRELKQYLQDQYDNDEVVLLALKERLNLSRVFHDAVSVNGDRAALLERRMEGYDDASSCERVRAACNGCLDIMLAEIVTWPEYQSAIRQAIASGVESMNRTADRVERGLNRVEQKVDGLARNHAQPGGASVSQPPAVTDLADAYLRRWTEEPLFLDRGDPLEDIPAVFLADVHVTNRFESAQGTQYKDETKLWKWLSGTTGHLVLGAPGTGKSTLISWYLRKRKSIDGTIDGIRVFKLADFKLNGQNYEQSLLTQMGLTREKLKGVTLFLDGLDECGLTPDDRYSFLDALRQCWGNSFSWFVTCRVNYITPESSQKDIARRLQGITLLSLDKEQIGQFLYKYTTASGKPVSEGTRALVTQGQDSDNPFGIPLILYMVAATGIETAEKKTLVSVYDQLFDELCQRSYDSGHRITGEIKEELKQMSRDIALWMLLHNSAQAVIPEGDYQKIEQVFSDEIAERHAHRFGTYFHSLHHTEGKAELCFVHRTMYEYFVADGFVHLAVHAQTPEELSGIIAWYWQGERMYMYPTLQGYVQEKLDKHKERLDFSCWEKAGQELMRRGVRRCLRGIQNRQTGREAWGTPECLHPAEGDTLKGDRRAENAAFWNLCHLLVWVREITGQTRRVYEAGMESAGELLASAIRHCCADYLLVACEWHDMSHIHLRGANLSYSDLTYATLTGADLYGADLSGADLSGADLRGADLFRADLSGADLSGADLSGEDLRGAYLTYANLTDANLTGAVLREDDLKRVGFDGFASSRFSEIEVALRDQSVKEYPRLEFFQTFFPDHPYPGDASVSID